jgi:hypothetical protein
MNQQGSSFMAQLDALYGPLFLVLVLIGIIISFFVDGTSGFAILVAMGLGVAIDAWGEDYVSDLRIDLEADTLALTLEQPFSSRLPREQVMSFSNIHRMRHEPRSIFRQKGNLHLFTHDGEEHIFRTMPAALDLAKVNAAVDLVRRTEAPTQPGKSAATASTTKTTAKAKTGKSGSSKSTAAKSSSSKAPAGKSSQAKSSRSKSKAKPTEPEA